MTPGINENINLDLSMNRSTAVVYCRQGETNGRTINANITHKHKPVNMEALVFAEINIKKPDGTEVRSACIKDNNNVKYTIRTNDVAAVGEAEAQIILTFIDGSVMPTPKFSIIIAERMMGDIPASANDFSTLNQVLAQIEGSEEQARSYAKEAAAQAELAKNYIIDLPDDLHDIIDTQNAILDATKQIYNNAAEEAAEQIADAVQPYLVDQQARADLINKADKSEVYTKDEMDELINELPKDDDKVSAINEGNRNSEIKFPSVKAAADYVDGILIEAGSQMQSALDTKADKTSTYTTTEVDSALRAKADKSTTYTKSEVDTKVDAATPADYNTVKASVASNTSKIAQNETEISHVKEDLHSIDERVTTIEAGGGSGGGITIDTDFNPLSGNPLANSTITQALSTANAAFDAKADKSDVYTKTEADERYAFKGEGSTGETATPPYPVVNSLDEMIDTSKRYIYDGYVYAFEQNGTGGGAPTNLIYTSLATDDGVVDGVGYVNDMAMGGSSGTGAKAQSGFFATGYIPVSQNDVININQSGLQTANTNKRISLYNASKTRIQYYNCYGEISNSNMTLTGSGDYAKLTILSASVAFVRVSLPMPVTSATITREGDAGTSEPTYGWVKKYPYVPSKVATPLDKYAYQIDQCKQMGTRWDSDAKVRTTDGILTFMHVSDTHGVNVDNSVMVANELASNGHCAFVLHTGDIAKSTPNSTEFTKFRGEIAESSIPYMFVAGNHDMAKGNTDFANTFASEVGKWNVTNNPSGKTYWYKDFSDARVRLIGFFDYENDGGSDSPQYQAYSQAQITWFVNALLSTPAKYGVIVAKHNPVNVRGNLNNPFNTPSMIGSNAGQYWGDKNLLCDIVSAFMDGASINKTWTQTKGMTETITVNANFANKNSGAEFICYLNGHTHADGLSFLGGYPKQLEINIGADSWEDTRYAESVNEEGTLHQDCINYVSLDTNTGHIYIRRIGNDFSATAKRKDFTIIDYRNPSSGDASGSGTDDRVDDLAQGTGDYGFRKIYSQTFEEEAAANLSIDIPGKYRHVMIYLESTTDSVIGSDFSEFQFAYTNKKDNGGNTSARVYGGKYKTVFATADIDGDVVIVKSRGTSTGYAHTGHIDGYNLAVADNLTPTDASYIYKINYNVKMPAGSTVRVYAK